jgi:hypothetical protein
MEIIRVCTPRVMGTEVFSTRQLSRRVTRQDPLEGCNEASDSNQAQNKGLDKAHAVIVEYCAIGKESKKAEDGRRALEHTRAER